MTTPYQKGVRVERLLKQELESQGWTVIRSAGSKGPADLVAWRYLEQLNIQVKSCRSRVELRTAIKAAAYMFDLDGAFYAGIIGFCIFLRYRGMWFRVTRRENCWEFDDSLADLLGRDTWPITQGEV